MRLLQSMMTSLAGTATPQPVIFTKQSTVSYTLVSYTCRIVYFNINMLTSCVQEVQVEESDEGHPQVRVVEGVPGPGQGGLAGVGHAHHMLEVLQAPLTT
jgi:hypothetical protein